MGTKPKPEMSDTVMIAYNMVDHASSLLRTLIRTRFFKEKIPNDNVLSRTLHISRTSLVSALQKLIMEGLIEPTQDGYIYKNKPKGSVAGTIAFVLNANLLTSWYSLFQDYLVGFDKVMQRESYDVQLVSEFDNIDSKITTTRDLRAQGIMGFAFASYAEHSIRQFVMDEKIPSVVLGNASYMQEDLLTVSSDNRGGIRKLVDYLLSQNHNRIAMYACAVKVHEGFSDRFDSYHSAMRNAGLSPILDLVFEERHHDALAQVAATKFAAMTPRPTAIVCGSDREAYELIAELKRLNLSVPEDVSVTGFDDNHFSRILDPALTTVDIHGQELGRIAAQLLLRDMEEHQIPIHVEVPTSLRTRNSVKPMPLSSATKRLSGNLEDTKILSF